MPFLGGYLDGSEFGPRGRDPSQKAPETNLNRPLVGDPEPTLVRWNR
jgi:hypothetical protein